MASQTILHNLLCRIRFRTAKVHFSYNICFFNNLLEFKRDASLTKDDKRLHNSKEKSLFQAINDGHEIVE